MFQSTRLLDLPLIQMGQAQKHVTHNEALLKLDALVQPVAADLDRTVPPADPGEGDRHLVAPGATGDWAGQDGAIASFANGGWLFQAPQAGWKVRVLAADADAVFDGTAWRVEGPAPLPTEGAMLGLNAPADEVNRLTVAADATLLTHDGGGHQLKVNKATAGDTASLLFQTGYSGRAEMGTTGSDGFAVKVSADGASWATALRFDPATGRVDVPSSHGTWKPVLAGNLGGDLSSVTGLTVAYAYWWKVGPLVTIQAGFDFAGASTGEFSRKSTFSLGGLPFAPRNDGGAIDQGSVSGFVYHSIGSAQASLVAGGVSAPDRLHGFVFHTGSGEARPSDRFYVRATYMADG